MSRHQAVEGEKLLHRNGTVIHGVNRVLRSAEVQEELPESFDVRRLFDALRVRADELHQDPDEHNNYLGTLAILRSYAEGATAVEVLEPDNEITTVEMVKERRDTARRTMMAMMEAFYHEAAGAIITREVEAELVAAPNKSIQSQKETLASSEIILTPHGYLMDAQRRGLDVSDAAVIELMIGLRPSKADPAKLEVLYRMVRHRMQDKLKKRRQLGYTMNTLISLFGYEVDGMSGRPFDEMVATKVARIESVKKVKLDEEGRLAIRLGLQREVCQGVRDLYHNAQTETIVTYFAEEEQ